MNLDPVLSAAHNGTLAILTAPIVCLAGITGGALPRRETMMRIKDFERTIDGDHSLHITRVADEDFRIALSVVAKRVIAQALDLLGVEAPDRM